MRVSQRAAQALMDALEEQKAWDNVRIRLHVIWHDRHGSWPVGRLGAHPYVAHPWLKSLD